MAVSEGGPGGLDLPKLFQYLIFNQVSKPKFNKTTIHMFWTPPKKISGYGLGVTGSILSANKGAPLLLQNYGARGRLPPLPPPLLNRALLPSQIFTMLIPV